MEQRCVISKGNSFAPSLCFFTQKQEKKEKKEKKRRQENTDEFQLSDTLKDILSKAQYLSSVHATLQNITKTWNTYGPVFGTLHSLVIFYEKKREIEEHKNHMRHKFITFQLPSGEHLEIQYSEAADRKD